MGKSLAGHFLYTICIPWRPTERNRLSISDWCEQQFAAGQWRSKANWKKTDYYIRMVSSVYSFTREEDYTLFVMTWCV